MLFRSKTVRYVYNKDGSLKEEQIMGASTYKMRPKTIYYNPADGDPTTWVNGVPPQPATTPSTGENTTPSTPAETPATETPAETGGTETPAQDAQG